MLAGSRRAFRLISLTRNRFAEYEEALKVQPNVSSQLYLQPFQFLEETVLAPEGEMFSNETVTHIVVSPDENLLGPLAFTFFTHPELLTFFRKHVRLDVALPVVLTRTDEDAFRLTVGSIAHVRNVSGLFVDCTFEEDDANDKDHRAKLHDEHFLTQAVTGIYRRMHNPNVKMFLDEERWSALDGNVLAFELAPGLCVHTSYDRDHGFVIIDPHRFRVIDQTQPSRGSVEDGWLQVKLPQLPALSQSWVERLSGFHPERDQLSSGLQALITPIDDREPLQITQSSAFTWERFVNP